MSKDKSVALNMYGILDNELVRMHELLKVYLSHPKDPYHGGMPGSYSSNHSNIPVMYNRIVEIQDLLMNTLIAHDKVLQEKIAELALTSKVEE